MILGGILGFTGLDVPFVEQGILVSILVLGMLITGACKLPLAYSSLIVGIFAIFHGYAHGTGMPASIDAASYAAGFAMATALLHLTGIGMGVFLQKIKLRTTSRVIGSAIALSGIYLAIL